MLFEERVFLSSHAQRAAAVVLWLCDSRVSSHVYITSGAIPDTYGITISRLAVARAGRGARERTTGTFSPEKQVHVQHTLSRSSTLVSRRTEGGSKIQPRSKVARHHTDASMARGPPAARARGPHSAQRRRCARRAGRGSDAAPPARARAACPPTLGLSPSARAAGRCRS